MIKIEDLANYCKSLIKFKNLHQELKVKIEESHDRELWPDFLDLNPLLKMLISQLISVIDSLDINKKYFFENM